MKPRWTVAQPPRVHDLARITHQRSADLRLFLALFSEVRYGTAVSLPSASSKVPLRLALDYLNYKFFPPSISLVSREAWEDYKKNWRPLHTITI